MDRFSDDDMKTIRDRTRDRLISPGYDDSKLFVDGSNFYIFIEENEVAKKGHNKKHSYDLNQVPYYIAANYEYIPFSGDSYPGNVPDSKAFDAIIENTSENAILIFDRGYNSFENIHKIRKRKYVGALVMPDHPDLMAVHVDSGSVVETRKTVYGTEHRIILYQSSGLERKRTIAFMRRLGKI